MSDSTRYFQLTPDILVEYNYNNLIKVHEQEGNTQDYITDIDHYAYVVNNSYCATRTFFCDKPDDLFRPEKFVLPVNKSESKFVQCINGNNTWNNEFDKKFIFENSENNDSGDILCDTFTLHFTSRNLLGSNNYDGFIITVHIYDKYKNKIGLISQYIKKTDDPELNHTPVLINQKLYTTKLDFKIPNVYALIKSNQNFVAQALNNSEEILVDALSPKYGLMDNTPVVMSIYGVKNTNKTTRRRGTDEEYAAEKINSIYIPIIDKSENYTIEINEAEDGDYFEIYPKSGDNVISFSDYIYNISMDENGVARPEIYIVFHELTLTEHYTSGVNTDPIDDITHREQFIINVADEDGNVNEAELDKHIYYRPVLRHSSNDLSFTISVKTHIINTIDNTTIVINSEKIFEESSKKYGKKMNRIYLGDVPAIVNVYNKKPDVDLDGVRITNASSNVKIENHQHSVIGFIECANVGVSIEQIPTEQIK